MPSTAAKKKKSRTIQGAEQHDEHMLISCDSQLLMDALEGSDPNAGNCED